MRRSRDKVLETMRDELVGLPFSRLSICSLVKDVRFRCSFRFSRRRICESSSPDELCSELPSEVLSWRLDCWMSTENKSAMKGEMRITMRRDLMGTKSRFNVQFPRKFKLFYSFLSLFIASSLLLPVARRSYERNK
jgi:hypothetical protein